MRAGARTSPRRPAASAWNAVSKQATAGTPGSGAPTAASAASDAGWCSGASGVSARSASAPRRRAATGPVKRVAAVDDAVADGVELRPCRRARRDPPASVAARLERRQVALGEQLVAGAEQPELQAARARVDDEDPHARPRSSPSRPSPRPRPVAHVGHVVAVLARVGAVAQALVDHLLAHVRGRARRGRARGR